MCNEKGDFQVRGALINTTIPTLEGFVRFRCSILDVGQSGSERFSII
jgi:hypothetical protein